MSGILLVLICLAVGLFTQRSARFPKNTGQVLNAFVIGVALPALVFVQIHGIASQEKLTPALWLPISMAWIQFALSAMLFPLYRRALRFGSETAAALMLTVGLGNTSFVGFPLLEAFFGPEAIRTGVLIDQPGSFLALSTLGVLTVAAFGRGSNTSRDIIARVLRFPPFIALILGIATAPFTLPTILSSALERLGSTLVPVSLVAVGCQLDLDWTKIRSRLAPLAIGLTAKLVLIPLVMSVLFLKLFPYQGRVSEIIVVESAMAPMITASILASDADLDAELASLMVGVGIPLSLVTVPLWAKLLGFI